MRRMLWCYARGRKGAWEAICLDLDIAVQGRSLEDVQLSLQTAIAAYVEAAVQEEPRVRDKLLALKAPLLSRLRFLCEFLVPAIFSRRTESAAAASYNLPCRA